MRIINLMGRILIFLSALIIGKPEIVGQYSYTEKPKLVVGIVVDQMRYDYISRYWDQYGDDGFKKIIDEGYFFENGQYNYAPTYTAPGHASVFTGTTPAVHGIIGNTWYDKKGDEMMYCTQDTSVRTVGGMGSKGQMSPKNMLASTLADQINLSTNFRSKSIGVSIKDRGAILAAGHSGDGAYWFDSQSGNWITSTFYMDSLPQWVQDINMGGHVERFLSAGWNTLLPIEEYDASIVDYNPFEKPYLPGTTPTFPYKLDSLSLQMGPGVITATPFGNTLTKDFAKTAINAEGLGQDDFTDFLGISFSSTDYIGHQFGPRAIELQDTYLRLDLDIADLINHLDSEVGKGEYIVFLTSDHGAVETPMYLQNYNIPSGYFPFESYKNRINGVLRVLYGNQPWVKNYSNDQVFLDHKLIRDNDIDIEDMVATIIEYSIKFNGIANAISGADLLTGNFNYNNINLLQKGYNQKRSGDVVLLMEPGWIIYFRQGTTHGSSYPYDTHVPIIFYGKGIKSGTSFREFQITDIAPSLAAYLRIQAPNGATGTVHSEFFEF